MAEYLRILFRSTMERLKPAQAKLIQAIRGDIFDVCVDIRHGSPDFGRWFGIELSSDEPCRLFVPEGFAHGFCALSDNAKDPLLSPKDRSLITL